MKPITLTLAIAASLAAAPALAATPTAATAAAPDAAVAAAHARLAQAAKAVAALPAGPKAEGNNTYPGTPMANPYRAYPPSCAADPLPDRASGPTWSARVPLYTRDANGNPVGSEEVTMTIWRLACSSSGLETPYNTDGGYNAMTLLRIDRDSANEGRSDVFPTFPLLQAAQGSIEFGDDASLVRAAPEPNTVIADAMFDAPVYNSTTYVLENFPYGADYVHLYSYAFDLQVDPVSGDDPVVFNIPSYEPTQATYPDAFAPMPLDGYAAAQWNNADINEGVLVQVTEQHGAGGSMVRQVVFDLLSQDLDGNPLWLVGNAPFDEGDTSVTIPTIYLGNGLERIPFGTATVEMTDCNHLDITFVPQPSLDPSIPDFSGTTTYNRLFNANGMVCE